MDGVQSELQAPATGPVLAGLPTDQCLKRLRQKPHHLSKPSLGNDTESLSTIVMGSLDSREIRDS